MAKINILLLLLSLTGCSSTAVIGSPEEILKPSCEVEVVNTDAKESPWLYIKRFRKCEVSHSDVANVNKYVLALIQVGNFDQLSDLENDKNIPDDMSFVWAEWLKKNVG